MNLPEPPRPDLTGPPPPPPSKPIWKRWWFWVGVVVVIGVVGSAWVEVPPTLVMGRRPTRVMGRRLKRPNVSSPQPRGSTRCKARSIRSIEATPSLRPRTFRRTRPRERLYYVAVTVEGVPGVAVFGTSEPPLQADPGLIAGANATANQLSDLGIDISEDSSAGALLLDERATSAAESCTTISESGAAVTQTPTEQAKDALIAQGYEDLQLHSSDAIINKSGRDLCRGARRFGPELGADRLVLIMGRGFAESFNESLGTNLTPDDDAAIVEIFLTAFYPEVL